MGIDGVGRKGAPPSPGATVNGASPPATSGPDFATRLSSFIRPRGETLPADPALTAELLRLQLMEATLGLDAPPPGNSSSASRQLLEIYGQLSGDGGNGPAAPAVSAQITGQEEASSAPLPLNSSVVAPTVSSLHPPALSPSSSAVTNSAPPSHPRRAHRAEQTARAVLPKSKGESTVTAASRKSSQGEYADIISRAAQRYNVPGELISAVIQSESGFNAQAVSHAGAQGLMQLMPATAKLLGVTDSFNPEQNIMAGTRFLADLIRRYRGDIDSALAAYNWGPANVDRRPNALPAETRDYLAKVKRYVETFSAG